MKDLGEKLIFLAAAIVVVYTLYRQLFWGF